MKYTVIDTSTNTVIRLSVSGKSASQVLKKYLAKDWIRKTVGMNLEVMPVTEFEKIQNIY